MNTHHIIDVERAVRTALAQETRDIGRSGPNSQPAKAAPPPAGIQIRTILVPTDFSPISTAAIRYAHDFARLLHADLIFLHVTTPVSAPAYCPTSAVDELREIHRKEAEEALASLMKQADALPDGCKLRQRALVAEGDAALETDRVARECDVDLIIIASHGFTGLKHLLLGSTAEKVLRHAPCPVLVIRNGGEDAQRSDSEGEICNPCASPLATVAPAGMLFPED